MLTGLGTRAEERRCRYRDAFCRVRTLRSAIDVECPHCCMKPGQACVSPSFGGKLAAAAGRFHAPRESLFLSLTGQAPKDSRSGHDVEQRPEPGRPPAIVGSERGDSGTGRAAGSEAAGPSLQPAAPSGFRAPTDVYDVDCETCGAKGARSHTADRTAAFCREDGRRVEPHALRVAAFEARRAPPPPLPKCIACGHEMGPSSHVGKRDPGCCADCSAGNGRSVALVQDKLRADLDRPLPPKPAALKTWPEHWETPGWES